MTSNLVETKRHVCVFIKFPYKLVNFTDGSTTKTTFKVTLRYLRILTSILVLTFFINTVFVPLQITQFIYLCISLTHDILKKYLKWNQTIEWKLQQWKSYIFIAFVYPMTVTVGLMFWALYVLNREWVLPKASDVVFPSWYNHCVHTYILLFLIMETLLSDQQLPSFRSAFTGVSFIMLVYYTV